MPMVRWNISARRHLSPIATIFCLVVGHSADAQPTITDVQVTTSNGLIQLQATGTGFGARQSIAPLLWDDFESGTPGKLIASQPARIGTWDSGAGSEYVTYSDLRPFAGNKSARHDFTTYYNASLAKNGTFPKLYIDFWARPEMIAPPCNWKVWRLYGDNDLLQIDWVFFNTSSSDNVVDPAFVNAYWGHLPYKDSTWQHYQVVYQESTPGGSDGTLIHMINGEIDGANSSSLKTRTVSSHISEVRLGHFWSTDHLQGCYSPGAVVYIDNVYIDTSWTRMEVTDQPTYSASRARAVQLPMAWSDSTATATANLAGLPTSGKLYVYVFDESNRPNKSGFPISITAGVTPPPLAKPLPPTATTVK